MKLYGSETVLDNELATKIRNAIFAANIGDSSAEDGRVPAWSVEDVNSNCGDYGTDGADRDSKGTVAERMHAHEIRLPMALTAEAQQRF